MTATFLEQAKISSNHGLRAALGSSPPRSMNRRPDEVEPESASWIRYRVYAEAVEDALGSEIDYAMLVKLYGASKDRTD